MLMVGVLLQVSKTNNRRRPVSCIIEACVFSMMSCTWQAVLKCLADQ